MLSLGTRLFCFLFIRVRFQRLPKPIRVERRDSSTVASKAKPSFRTMERARRAMDIAVPSKESHARGPQVAAVTVEVGLDLLMRSQRTA